MTDKLEETSHTWTNRLEIKFKNITIGADIESGVTLSDALKEIAKSCDKVRSGEYTDITDMEL